MRGRQEDRVEGLELTSSHNYLLNNYQQKKTIKKDTPHPTHTKSQLDVLPRTNQEEMANTNRLIISAEIETVI